MRDLTPLTVLQPGSPAAMVGGDGLTWLRSAPRGSDGEPSHRPLADLAGPAQFAGRLVG